MSIKHLESINLETLEHNAIYTKAKEHLNGISHSFCAAKWLQTTIHLQNGNTHSCHHPDAHKVPVREVEKNPAALHNSIYKKRVRKMMLEGEKPEECYYCWDIEKASDENFSDRIIKSSSDWAYSHIDEIVKKKWFHDIAPSYLEVSFGHECNLACCYCRADVSSRILAELQQHGDYPSPCYPSYRWLKENKKIPIPSNQPNPYIDAFWKWFPDIITKLHSFRITGGEPLINENTFKLLDYLIDHQHPGMELSINSNLCVNDRQMQRFYEKLKRLVPGVNVKNITLFGSIDGHGKAAEYTRFGLNYDKMLKRMEYLLENFPHVKIFLMCTYNVFSIVSFNDFLEDLYNLRKMYFEKYGNMDNPIGLDISHLTNPSFLKITTMRKEYAVYIKKTIEFMKARQASKEKPFGFTFDEVNKITRIYHWFINYNEKDDPIFFYHRYNFYLYFTEYDKRKHIKLEEWCPEYLNHFNSCYDSYIYLSDGQRKLFDEVKRRAEQSKHQNRQG